MAGPVVSESTRLRNVSVDGEVVDCLVVGDRIAALGSSVDAGDAEIDGAGGALLPGLADHHLHLFAMAAAAMSVDLSGSSSYDELVRAARERSEVRAVGWDEERLGDLDRDRLDALAGATPTRVQHRSGAVWVLNSPALAGLDQAGAPAGAERDAAGRLTGKVWRADDWLRSAASPPDLAQVGCRLAGYGITAVTDATPDLDAAAVDALIEAKERRSLPQRLHLLGADSVAGEVGQITVGPRKLVLADHDLPAPDELGKTVADLHAEGRPVAMHCISRAALALAIAALRATGSLPGDRIEHCAVADLTAIAELAACGVTVVTQPSLLARRGDDYLDRHPPDEHADLWRYRSFLGAGIRVVPSSDAPYGDANPWSTIRAARDRATASGRVLGASERVAAAVALGGLLRPVTDPAAPPRRIAVGAPADLMLLGVPLDVALAEPSAEVVGATIIAGRVVYRR